MAGRRVHDADKVNKRIEDALLLFDQVEAPEYLHDLVFNTCWNVTGIPEHIVPREQALADMQEALLLVSEAMHSDAVRRSLYTALIPLISEREYVAGLVMPGKDAPPVLQ